MRISDIMSSPVVSVEMDDDLHEVKRIFDNTRFHHLLVVDDGILHGVIGDRDMLRCLSPYIGTPSEGHKDLATLNRKAHHVMSRRPVTLQPDAPIAAAVQLFNSQIISCIPVVDEEHRPVGIVSWRDILKALPQLGLKMEPPSPPENQEQTLQNDATAPPEA